jgi:hypothetical protein
MKRRKIFLIEILHVQHRKQKEEDKTIDITQKFKINSNDVERDGWRESVSQKAKAGSDKLT